MYQFPVRGWSGVVKVSCILRHRGVQLILAYSWERPAILVAGKSRGGMFLFLLFLHFHSCSSFPSPLLSLLSLFSLSLGDNSKWPTRVDVSLNTNAINHSLRYSQGRQLSNLSLPPFWKGVYSKWKECAPHGSKFFPFIVDPLSETACLVCRKEKQEVTNVVSLVQNHSNSTRYIKPP